MDKNLRRQAGLFLGLGLLAAASASAEPRQFIVLYKDATAAGSRSAAQASPAAALRARSGRPALQAVAAAAGASNIKDLWVVNGYALTASAEAAEALARDPQVEGVFENFEVRTPEVLAAAQAQGAPSENWGLAKIGAPQAWNAFGVTGRGVRIGHLDTGVDASHPDLRGKVAAWAEFDASGNRVGGAPRDSGVHGTHTAGTLVGGSSLGVAPGAKLISALVLNGNTGTLVQVLAGMQWVLDPDGNPATDDGADILSMSLGAPGQYEVFRVAVDRLLAAGVLPVFAIGNSGAGQADAPGNVPGAMSVGATAFSDTVASFSGGGQVTWSGRVYLKPEISAPGYGVVSCVPGNRYQAFSGTSMATPHVAGAAALLLEAKPSLTVDELRDVLLRTSVDLLAPGQDVRSGHGRLDVLAALSSVKDLSLVRGVARGSQGPMAAVIRVKGADGRETRAVRADPSTGRFELSLSEGHYTLEAAFGTARGAEKKVQVAKGAVVTVDLTLGASSSSLDNVLTYPNPFKPSRGDQEVRFDGLPQDAKVTIYSLSGEVVKELGTSAGQSAWDARNMQGEAVAGGVYFYVASHYDANGGWNHKRGKLAVIR